MMLKLVKQPPGSNLCGQAVVATLCGISLEESIEAFGKSGLTTANDIRAVLERFGFYFPHTRMVHIVESTVLPERCLVTLFWYEETVPSSWPRMIERRHWHLRWDGHTYDSALGVDTDWRFLNVDRRTVGDLPTTIIELNYLELKGGPYGDRQAE